MPQPRDKKLSKRAQKRIETGDAPQYDPEVSNLRPLSMSAPMHAWPVYECIVPETWATPGELVQLIVSRRSDAGEFASALFLVDLGCLGIKNAYAVRFTDESEYRAWLRTLPVQGAGARISVDLAAKIVETAVDYAASLGFRPHKDYALASPFLRGAEPAQVEEDVPTGLNGQPLFIAGPFDDVRGITQRLNRRVGPGNFQVVAPAGGLAP